MSKIFKSDGAWSRDDAEFVCPASEEKSLLIIPIFTLVWPGSHAALLCHPTKEPHTFEWREGPHTSHVLPSKQQARFFCRMRSQGQSPADAYRMATDVPREKAPLNPAHIGQIIGAYRRGVALRDIADRFGIDCGDVQRTVAGVQRAGRP